ncbi:MAG: GAF domain-containing protein, partial [Omnitrophica WOR_2 bacterium]
TQATYKDHGFQSVLYQCLQLSLEGTGADSGSLIAADDQGRVIDAAIAYHHNIQFPGIQGVVDLMECGLAGWVYRNRQPACIENTLNDPRWLKRSWDETGDQSRSAISVPLIRQEGVSGVLTLANTKPGQFSQGHLVMLLAFCASISLGEKIPV